MPQKRKRQSSTSSSALSFFDDVMGMKSHCDKLGDLNKKLDDSGGIVFIDDFLPLEVAVELSEYVETGLQKEGVWEREASDARADTNDVQFGFNVASGTGSELVRSHLFILLIGIKLVYVTM